MHHPLHNYPWHFLFMIGRRHRCPHRPSTAPSGGTARVVGTSTDTLDGVHSDSEGGHYIEATMVEGGKLSAATKLSSTADIRRRSASLTRVGASSSKEITASKTSVAGMITNHQLNFLYFYVQTRESRLASPVPMKGT